VNCTCGVLELYRFGSRKTIKIVWRLTENVANPGRRLFEDKFIVVLKTAGEMSLYKSRNSEFADLLQLPYVQMARARFV